MRKRFLFPVLAGCVLTFAALAFSCKDGNNANENNPLVGTVWASSGDYMDYVGVVVELHFTSNTDVTIKIYIPLLPAYDLHTTYLLNGDTVTVIPPQGIPVPFNGTLTISGNEMTDTFGVGVVFTRQ